MTGIPGYTLLRELGRGGMATVHLAIQESLGREVALKRLAPASGDADGVAAERFLREARIAASLHHPNILPIHDFGVHDGVPYLAMEYESGGTIAPMPGEKLAPRDALRIVRDIASALDYAHGRGVVHRDIKPDNILRRADGGAMLSDFGIARLIQGESVLTTEGTSVGTPHYMSPEQLRGEKVDGRSDLYSLGIVLWQLLTGEQPFMGNDSWAIGMQHINAPVPRLPEGLAHLQPLLDALLAKQPGARLESGAELVRGIDGLLATAPTPLATPATVSIVGLPAADVKVLDSPPPGPGWSRVLARVAVAGLVVLPLLAVVHFGFDKFVPQHRREAAEVTPGTQSAQAPAVAVAETAVAPGVAVLPFENMSPDPDNAFFAGGVFEEVLTKLSKVPQLRVISRTSMEQIAKQNLEVSAIGKRLGVSHVLEGSVRRAGDRVRVTVQLIEARTDNHVWADTYDRQLDDVFAIQSEIALAIADQLKITLSPQLQSNLSDRLTKNQAAYDLYLRAVDERRVWRSAASFRAMISLLEPAVAADPDFLRARVMLADAYGRMYWFGEDPDNQYVAKARALVADVRKRWPDHPDSQLAQAQLLYNVDRNYEAALQRFRELEAALPGDMSVVSGVSSSLKRLSREKEFLVAARRRRSLDPESPLTVPELMFALDANRLYDEELALGEEGVRKFPEDESIAYYYALLRLRQRGDIDAMLDYGRRFNVRSEVGASRRVAIARFVRGDIEGALAVRADSNSDSPLVNAISDAEHADLLQLVGRGAEAQALAARALDVVSSAITEGRPAPRGQVAGLYANAASIAALAGDGERAAAWERKAKATPLASADEEQMLARSLADLRRFSGDPDGAWRIFAKTIDVFNGTAKGELTAFKPYYDRLYGKSPTYRAYMAKLVKQP